MPELDFPPITSEGQQWTDNDGATWQVWRGAWVRTGGVATVLEVPTGTLLAYGTTIPPAGYLYCNGQEISRTTYAGLFGVIGETYGAGDGSTTFKVPDLRGRVLAGADDTSERLPGIDAVGQTTGASTHTLTEAQLPAHTHSGSSNSTGSHAHTASSNSTGSHGHTASSNSTGSHTHSDTTGSGDKQHLHGITIRSLNQNAGGSNTYVHPSGQLNTWNQNIAHTHSVSTSSNGAHSHTITVNSGGSHSHTITVGSTGSGSAHKYVQPSLTIVCIIKI